MNSSLIKAYIASVEDGYPNAVSFGIQWIGLDQSIKPSDTIFIKPNFTFPVYRRGVMTNPDAIEAVIASLRNYTKNIIIGDADSGGYNCFPMEEVFKEVGLNRIAEKYNVKVVNLSKLERKSITFKYKNRNFFLDLPRLLTDEIDLLITMPVPKVHANTVVSLTFKNQWGCIPEPSDRLRLHPYLKHVIIEVNKAVKARVAIIDGKYGLNENGPMEGHPIELNWILVTNDIGAGARLSSELMQIPLKKIPHLKYAEDQGIIPKLNEIIINQSLHPFLKEKFVLRRKLTDYPGFLAFHNSFLAWLAYFSPLSNFLHKILYLFRNPFYDYEKNQK